MRLFIVEDEKEICDTVAKSLYDAGYEVDTCYDGEEALAGILTENYDLVVLDLNLPGMDGMEILKELRQENEETKVLILSARGQIADKVEALDAGANDYMEKPFHLQELEARIRSLTRRKFVQKDVCLESGEIKFDTVRREAYAKGEMVSLTRKENGILEYLLLNMGRPVSQEELMEHVWDASVDSFSGAIRVHMSSLRKKLKAVLGYDPIVNKVGEGYKMREESAQVLKLNQLVPLPTELALDCLSKTKRLLVAEECITQGSPGQGILAAAAQSGLTLEGVAVCSCGKDFVPHGTIPQLRSLCGLDIDSLYKKAKEVMEHGR